MPLIYDFCGFCGKKTQMQFNQLVDCKKLIWNLGYQCSHCCKAIEEDGAGDIPDKWRAVILAEQGTWNLTVLETGKAATIAAKILRAALELSLAEAMQLKKMMPGSVFTGTPAEAERLRQLLVAENINAFANQIII